MVTSQLKPESTISSLSNIINNELIALVLKTVLLRVWWN